LHFIGNEHQHIKSFIYHSLHARFQCSIEINLAILHFFSLFIRFLRRFISLLLILDDHCNLSSDYSGHTTILDKFISDKHIESEIFIVYCNIIFRGQAGSFWVFIIKRIELWKITENINLDSHLLFKLSSVKLLN
jgi:hypothetical protein